LAESRVGWAFWPPGTPVDQISNEGHGIWIPRGDNICDPDNEDIDQDSEDDRHVSFDTEDEEIEITESEDEDATEEEDVAVTGLGRFGALALSDEEDEE